MNEISKFLDKRYKQIDPVEFYREIFRGELDKKDAFTPGKYCGIVVSVSKEKKNNNVHRYTITDDLETIEQVVKTDDFCICSPISYAGRKRSAENARYLYAIVIDLDRINLDDYKGEPLGCANLIHQIETNYIPKPTYIVSSGSGMHLYYCLDMPVPLYENIARELQEFKKELTKLIWNGNVVKIKDQTEIQLEGIYQGYRMPGTVTKFGTRALAFMTGNPVSLEYLGNIVKKAMPQTVNKQKKLKKNIKTLEEARKAYPEWYERRIINKEPKGVWHTSRNVYEWWKRQIETGAVEGHRYFCLMILAMYGKKCSFYDEKHNPNPVTQEEVERDCLNLVELLDSRTVSDAFTRDDALKALEAYDEKWITYPVTMIEYRSGIRIEKNKRNYQKQADHLEEARAIQAIRCKRTGTNWREGSGRKSLKDTVLNWRLQNIRGSKAECIRETGLSKATVNKHWDIWDVDIKKLLEEKTYKTDRKRSDFIDEIIKSLKVNGMWSYTIKRCNIPENDDIIKNASEGEQWEFFTIKRGK